MRAHACTTAALLLAACTPTPAPAPAPPPAPPPVIETAAPIEEPVPDEPEVEMRVTESGLGIEDLKVGSGPAVEDDQRITVHYVGRFDTGKVFDDSRKRNEPYTFQVGRSGVIAGWHEGVVGMQVGGLRRLTVPAKLGYGERGRMPTIPPNALLEFEIELIAIE